MFVLRQVHLAQPACFRNSRFFLIQLDGGAHQARLTSGTEDLVLVSCFESHGTSDSEIVSFDMRISKI